MDPDLFTKTSQHSFILVDACTNTQTWDTLKGAYESVFAISVGEENPWGVGELDELPTEDDIRLLLAGGAVLLLADSERYRKLAEEAAVRFFKVV